MTSTLDVLQAEREGAPLAPSPSTRASRAHAPRPRVGVYARISAADEDDRTETGHNEEGVSRQRRVCKLLAKAREWDIHDYYVDNNVSAFRDRPRKEFERLLADLDRGEIDGIIAYNIDRLSRRIKDLERIIDIYDAGQKARRTMYFATNEGTLDFSNSTNITMMRVMVAFANQESRNTKRRVELYYAAKRDDGIAGGTWRPFGWDKMRSEEDGLTLVINPREAELIRRAADMFTRRVATWTTIADEWNSVGVTSTQGNKWVPYTVRHVMTSPRLAGWITYKNKIALHSETGRPIRARNVEPILTDEQYEAILALVERRGGSPKSGRRKYLLSGLLRCEQCGGIMDGMSAPKKGKDYSYYRCSSAKRATNGGRRCGKIAIRMPETDDLIEKLIAPIVASHAGDVVVREENPFHAELESLHQRRGEWVTEAKNQGLSPAKVLPFLVDIDEKIDRLTADQKAWAKKNRQTVSTAGVTENEWRALSTEEKRAHIEIYLNAIYVKPPARRRQMGFDPERLSVSWRTEPESDGS